MSTIRLTSDDRHLLDTALAEARAGLAEGGVPIGAALAADGELLAAGRNQRIQRGSAVLHGEMAALEAAGRQTPSVYRRATMVTTLSPCIMCSGAILLFDIPRVIVGENHSYQGAEELLIANGVEVVVVDDGACIELMAEFVAASPDIWLEDTGGRPAGSAVAALAEQVS